MYGGIAKTIRKRFNDLPESQQRRALKDQFDAIADFPGLLAGLLELEKVVSSAITAELSSYDLDGPIRDQESRLKHINRYADVLFLGYLAVESTPGAIPAADGKLAETIELIDVEYGAAKDDARAQEFLTCVRDFLILGLWVSSQKPNGKRLVQWLANNNKPMAVTIRFCGAPRSLLANPGGDEVFAVTATDAMPDEGETDRQMRARLGKIKRAGGSPSTLEAPVWVDGLDDLTRAFDHMEIQDALRNIMRGSISFDQEGAPFYSPSRIELGHELVHVYHNANGSNRLKLPISPQASHVWKDAEEYWTITGGTATENSLAEDIGLQMRYAHTGVRLLGLDPNSPDAALSFRQHFEFRED